MKKAVSISYVVLANLLILAHAAVPHHHHARLFEAAVGILDLQTQSLFAHFHCNEEHHLLQNGKHAPIIVVGDWQLQDPLETGATNAGFNGQNLFAVAYARGSELLRYPPRDLRAYAERSPLPVAKGFATCAPLRRGPPLG